MRNSEWTPIPVAAPPAAVGLPVLAAVLGPLQHVGLEGLELGQELLQADLDTSNIVY